MLDQQHVGRTFDAWTKGTSGAQRTEQTNPEPAKQALLMVVKHATLFQV